MNLLNELRTEHARHVSRRWFLRDCTVGLGSIALASLGSSGKALAATNPLAPRQPHFPAKAKRVIYLFQAGAPSHLDLFDNKPELAKRSGQLPPADLLKDYRAAFIDPNSALLGPKFNFNRYGKSGMELSETLPHTGSVADELCLIRSMQTDAVNHAPGQLLMNTGSQLFGRPSFGAWSLYGLGSENENLPGYVVLNSAKGTSGGASNWSGGFLPTVYSGVAFRGGNDPIPFLSNPAGYDQATQRAALDTLKELNEHAFDGSSDPEATARIQSYEMAYRMQSSAPELMDLSSEPQSVLDAYGCDPAKPSFAKNCLLARRLAERGVRFVQLFHEAWDQHGNLKNGLTDNCEATDRASAALVKDLKERGLLDDTIVIWGGEFGRTPMVQGGGDDGRDHHNRCFSMWLAGGGFKPGLSYGATDDLGFNVTEKPVHVHDLHATLMHQLGFDHTRLTFRSQGRDFRLTDVHGKVVKEILA
jgi:hypothetical protein